MTILCIVVQPLPRAMPAIRGQQASQVRRELFRGSLTPSIPHTGDARAPHIRRELIRGSFIPSHSNRLTDEPVASGDGLAVGTRRGAPGSHAGLGPGTRGGLQRASRVSEVPVHQYKPVHTSTPVHCTGTSTRTRVLVLVLVHRPLGYIVCPNTGIGKY